MAPTEESLETGAAPPVQSSAPSRASITPLFPLLLLQTMRDMDRPTEVLEDETFTASLPRRLGLNDVVGRQIHRFEGDVKRRRRVDVPDMENMIRLVARRPDAGAIFREAGRRMALDRWSQRSGATRRTLRFMPRSIALGSAARAVRRLLRELVGDGIVELRRKPLEVRIRLNLTARSDPSGSACAFFTGALEELLQRYTGRQYHVLHENCESSGMDICEWTVRVGS
jgi:predicted hydrocarbon binding protein